MLGAARTPCPCWFAPQYHQRLDRVRQTTTSALASDALRDYHTGRRNTRTEFINAVGNPLSRHPCEQQTSIIKFFFDYDKVVTRPHTHVFPSPEDEQELQRCLAQTQEEAKSVMEDGAGATPGTYRVYVASRHGFLPEDTDESTTVRRLKISFRLFVEGYRTTPYGIKNAIKLAQTKNGNRTTCFDTSVYSRNRRLCMILAQKNLQDNRLLIPEPWTEDLMPYLAQHVEPTWPMKDVDSNAAVRQQMMLSTAAVAAEEEGEEEEDGPSNRRPQRRRLTRTEATDNEGEEHTTTRPPSDEFEIIKDCLRDAGFSNAHQIHPARVQARGVIHVPFDCEARTECPVCKLQHDRQNWIVLIDEKKGIAVRNLSTRCFIVPLMSLHFMHPFVTDLAADVKSHMHYASWFLKSRENTLRYHQGTGCFHEFKQQQWKQVPDELIHEHARVYLAEQLLSHELSKAQKWKITLNRLGLTSGNVSDHVDHLEKHVRKAINNVGNYPFLVNIIKVMRGMCFADSMLFDRQHHLLHFANGALDLNTKQLRETLPEDYNTLTTGYDFNPEPHQEAVNAHRDFMNKVYPDPAVREVAQRVMGSTLTGHNHGKKMFIFTDYGGETGGNNGKTKVFVLHQKAMGDYAIVPKKDFLYDGPTNAEGASPFMAKLRGKRVAVPEELEPHKKLAEGIVKELTNGTNQIIPVRDLWQKGSIMETCVKLMVGCNRGKFPRFDPYDEALTNRLLTIPHMSHFTSNPQQWNAVRHIYPVVSNIEEKLTTEDGKMAHMLWCLEGYDNFVRLGGFGTETLPTSVLEFKRAWIFKNTPVYSWLGEVLEETADTRRDVLAMAVVWDLYKKDRRSYKFLTMEQFESSFKVNT